MNKNIVGLRLATIAFATTLLIGSAQTATLAQSDGATTSAGSSTGTGTGTTTTAAPVTTDREEHHDWGWIGLLGLAGLAGLRKDRNNQARTGTR